MKSRLVIAFLPRSKYLLNAWLKSPSAVILEPSKIKSVTVSIVSPFICHEVMGLDAMILVFFFFPFIFISWRLITLQYCSGFCHTLTWISHGVACIPHPNPPSHLPLHPEGEGGMFRENSIETCILSIVKQITSPGWMHETSARAGCTGKTQRDLSFLNGWVSSQLFNFPLSLSSIGSLVLVCFQP